MQQQFGTPTRHRSFSLPPSNHVGGPSGQPPSFSPGPGPGGLYYHGGGGGGSGYGSENPSRVESPIGSEFSYQSYGSAGGGHAPPSPQSAYYQLADTNIAPYEGPYFQVQFKRCHRCFILSPAAPNHVKPGDFVIVEGDRGEDLGVVVAMAPRDSPMVSSIFAACASTLGRGALDPSGHSVSDHAMKKILRIASMQVRVTSIWAPI